MTKRGRPEKPPEEKRWQRLDVRVSEAEKEAFRLAAESANQDLSVWIRVHLHRAASQDRPEDDGVDDHGDKRISETDAHRASGVR